MKNVTLYTKWLGLVFVALVLAACSGNDTKEQEAAAAAAEQAAQEAAAQEAAQSRLRPPQLQVSERLKLRPRPWERSSTLISIALL